MNQVFIGALDLSAYPFELHDNEYFVSLIFPPFRNEAEEVLQIQRALKAKTIYIRTRKHLITRIFESGYLDENMTDNRQYKFRLWGYGRTISIYVRKAKEPK